MTNNKALFLLGIGAMGAMLLISRKAGAQPLIIKNNIEITSCTSPESIITGDDINTEVALSAPSTNTQVITKTIKAQISNCIKTKDITMNPGETTTENITFKYEDCLLDAGDYDINIDILQ